jgi:hypothetical protein
VRQAEERLKFGSAYADEGWIVAEADGSLVEELGGILGE